MSYIIFYNANKILFDGNIYFKVGVEPLPVKDLLDIYFKIYVGIKGSDHVQKEKAKETKVPDVNHGHFNHRYKPKKR